MSILIDETKKVLVQGITGREGMARTKLMLDYGTHVVAGCTPGKGGQEVLGVKVYDAVEEAIEKEGSIDVSGIFIPAPLVKSAALEAIHAGIKLLVIVPDRVPIYDVLEISKAAEEHGARFIGPNTLGLLSPGKAVVGMIGGKAASAREWFKPGPVGVASRSGGITSSISYYLNQEGIGQTTIVHVGGDAVVGLPLPDAVREFQDDEETELVVIFGENVSFDHYFGTYPNATNPPGESVFTPAPNTPPVNGLSGDLLTNNPNKNNTSNAEGRFVQNSGSVSVPNVGMCIKSSTQQAYYELNDGTFSANRVYIGRSGANQNAVFTQSGGTATISDVIELGTVAGTTGQSIYNLDGGELTITDGTPFTFTQPGAPAYFDFDGGALNLLGTWDFTTLTGIANSDFRALGVAATAADLDFAPITIGQDAYTRITNAATTVIPEPSTLLIWALGLLVLIGWRRRKR